MAGTLTSAAEPENASSSSLEELANWLSENPGDKSVTPGELARRFGLKEQFVEDVIEALEHSEAQIGFFKELSRRMRATFAPLKRRVRYMLLVTRRWLEDQTKNPVRFALGTGAAAYVFGFGFPVISNQFSLPNGARLGVVVGTIIFAGFTFMLHLYCFYRHRMLRYPLYAAFALYLLHIPFNIAISAYIHAQGMQVFYITFVGIAIGCLGLSAIYLPISLLASLVGGYAAVHSEARRDQLMSRQELLGRLFQTQARLAGLTAGEGIKRRKTIKALLQSAPSYPALAALIGLCLGGTRVILIGFMQTVWLNSGGLQEVVIGLTKLAADGILLALMGFIGFFAGSAWRGMFSVLVSYGAVLLAYMIPIGEYGPRFFRDTAAQGGFIAWAAIAASIGLMAGMGASIERSLHRTRRFRNDDPAILLAEMVHLKRRLSAKTESTTVLVVDVARSTAMKADADPFDIEYTFREYQRIVDRCSRRWAGEVVSTAGDGAVAAFSEPQQALNAAREILSDMVRFNNEVNRLGKTFRLRMGIHTGFIKAGLDEVPFNELIDIAAHVEQNAPVGGIAVTGAVRDLLPEEGMVEVNKIVDNQQLHIVLNPTEV